MFCLLPNPICKACNSKIKCLENAAATGRKLGFQDESRQEEATLKKAFVEKEVSFIKTHVFTNSKAQIIFPKR